MKVSVVIPVYNEAERLRSCLQAFATQSVKPYEVIVVDNNSTDDTLSIAREFDFVTVLSEPRQGVVHARNRGFDAARGDIIGRIDADTIVPPNWVEQITRIMRDTTVTAVSGAPHYYDFALSHIADKIDGFLRAHLARMMKEDNFLWGANMAVRRNAWQAVRQELCQEAGLHEDFDLGIHLQAAGFSVIYNPHLVAGISSRRIDSDFIGYVRYTLVSPRTYALHALKSRRHMYPVLFACWFFYGPGRLIYRSYDPETGTFSLSQLMNGADSRVDPTTNVV